MGLLVHIDNEVRGLPGQWDAVLEDAPSTITQTTDAGFPRRGRMGLRAITDGAGNESWVQADVGYIVPNSGSVTFGFWFRLNAEPAAAEASILHVRRFAGVIVAALNIWRAGGQNRLVLIVTDAGGTESTASLGDLVVGRWHHIGVILTRASADLVVDGIGSMYLDGTLLDSTDLIDNWTEMDRVVDFRCGWAIDARDGNTADFDEIRMGTTLADVRPTPDAHRDVSRYPDFRLVQADTRLGWRRLRRRII